MIVRQIDNLLLYDRQVKHMQWKRMFSTEPCKNTYRYIDTQKKYEAIRTALYFGISIALFITGYVTTNTKTNLLTVVAILGCLPASKSLVSMIMFFRFHSCSTQVYEQLEPISETIEHLYDLVFTTEKVNFVVAHAAYRARCLVLYAEQALDTQALEAHIQEYMKRAHISGVHVKVYTDQKKYRERLQQLQALDQDEQEHMTAAVMQLLREITL